MERKLASIQKVSELFPIEGADKIEGCSVLGWQCVVQKGEFKPGDIGVYFEIDSVLPSDKPEFAFLEPRKYRIRTIRLRKQIAQGLMLPLSKITYADLSSFQEGDDVTELLGVQKYEPPEESEDGANFRSRRRGVFPSFLRKTDELRIQSVPGFLDRHRGKTFYATEKVDGSSVTLFYLQDALYGKESGYFGVCSRNMEVMKDDGDSYRNAFWEAVENFDLENKIKSLGANICVQGELVGTGIQKNKYKLTDRKIFLYSAYDVVTQRYINRDSLVQIANALGLDTVPMLGEFVLNHTVSELVEMSRGYSKLNPATLREGIVCRPIEECGDPETGRASFKAIQPEFLLKYAE